MYVDGIDKIWAADQDKTGKSVADAFKEIFKKSKRKPEKLWTDKGREFYNKHVKELGVE